MGKFEIGDKIMIKEGITYVNSKFSDYETGDVGVIVGITTNYYFVDFETTLFRSPRYKYKVLEMEMELDTVSKTLLWKELND